MSAIDEASTINMNSEFIAQALGVTSVEAYHAGEGEDVAGKAKFAFPLEPELHSSRCKYVLSSSF